METLECGRTQGIQNRLFSRTAAAQETLGRSEAKKVPFMNDSKGFQVLHHLLIYFFLTVPKGA